MNGESTDTTLQATGESAVEQVPDGESSLSALQTDLDRARADAERLRDDMLRARAELDNVRKRAQRDVEAAHRYGNEQFVQALIPVKDSLDLGLDAAQATSDVQSLRDGMALTIQLFDSALEKMGVTAIDPLGEPFDPAVHQAMMTETSTTAAPGTVLRVMQKGYLLNDRIVRPAMVVVARGPE